MTTAIDIKEQQRAQWRDAAGAWDQYFEWYSRAFAPVMTWCADAIAAAPGMRVLDIAAGSGQPALAIAPRLQPGGTILGIDFSPEMVAVAERRARQAGASNVSFSTMDAEQLELADASFDAVTCACGLIFFPDAHRALAEMRRVLKPGGRIAIVVWDEPSKSPFVTVGGGAISRFHAPTPSNPNSPGAFRFAKPGVLERVLREAGFGDVSIASVAMPIEFESTQEYWEMFTECAAGIKTRISTLSKEDQVKLRGLVDELAVPHMVDGRVRLASTPLCGAARG
jgi:ubiquinone/menaquinone biosynthesis C-methylase UbiE